ncbi:MAG: GNAT family protein, partial [Thermomicrobiales bacterium]
DNEQRLRHDVGFAVCLVDRENDHNHVIGEVAILHVDYVNQHGETASWMFDPAYRGSGYGSEAKHLLLDYCFNTLGLRAVTSCVSTENARSAAALRKQGYREVGVRPWLELDHGFLSGDIIFHLTAEDWRALPRATAAPTHESEDA